MKFFITTLLIVIASSWSFGQDADYIIMEGKIGTSPITMQLYRAVYSNMGESSYTGSYYYQQYQVPLDINTVEETEEKLVLESWVEENKYREVFDGKIEGNEYKGIWTKEEKKLPFSLKIAPNDKYTEFVHLSNYRDIKVVPKGTIKSATGTCTYNFYLPKDTALQKLIVKENDDSYEDFESYSGKGIQRFLDAYKNEMSELEVPDTDDIFASLDHEILYGAWPYLDSPEYLIMIFSYYGYMGGAHGISSMNYVNYDKVAEKILKLEDVLDLTKDEEINKVLNDEIRKRYKIKPGGKLNDPDTESPIYVESLQYSEKFAISKHGITFFYDPYEGTPYAYGYFSQYVPFVALKSYLNKDFKY